MFTLTSNWDSVKKEITEELNRRVNEVVKKSFEIETDIPLDGVLALEIDLIPPKANITDYVNRLFDKATPKVFQALADQLQDNMRAGNWGWRDGTRDIVDTGDLLDSQSVMVSGSTMTISYNSPYAAITHYGGYIYPYGNTSAQRVYLPARPWITATIQGGGPVPQFDFYQAYLTAMGLR